MQPTNLDTMPKRRRGWAGGGKWRQEYCKYFWVKESFVCQESGGMSLFAGRGERDHACKEGSVKIPLSERSWVKKALGDGWRDEEQPGRRCEAQGGGRSQFRGAWSREGESGEQWEYRHYWWPAPIGQRPAAQREESGVGNWIGEKKVWSTQ